MKKAIKTVVYDDELQVEAYRFQGIMQPFPNHFHSYYVIGFVENGTRILSCKNQEYCIKKGDIVLFHPGDNHACVQSTEEALDYRGISITEERMLALTEEITGKAELPGFSQNVLQDAEAACYLRTLHELVMQGGSVFEKEENLILLLSNLMQQYGQAFEYSIPVCSAEIEKACSYMQEHYAKRICLEEICHFAGLSRSTLLRAFTRMKGVTPYCYLENIRIGNAKKLLEQGVLPVDAALQTGFTDQAHFTNYFSRFIGVAPGVYRKIFSEKQKEERFDEE